MARELRSQMDVLVHVEEEAGVVEEEITLTREIHNTLQKRLVSQRRKCKILQSLPNPLLRSLNLQLLL